MNELSLPSCWPCCQQKTNLKTLSGLWINFAIDMLHCSVTVMSKYVPIPYLLKKCDGQCQCVAARCGVGADVIPPKGGRNWQKLWGHSKLVFQMFFIRARFSWLHICCIQTVWVVYNHGDICRVRLRCTWSHSTLLRLWILWHKTPSTEDFTNEELLFVRSWQHCRQVTLVTFISC